MRFLSAQIDEPRKAYSFTQVYKLMNLRTSSKINLTVRRDSSKIIRRCRRGPSNSSSIYIYIHDVFCVKSAIRNLGNNLPNHFASPQRFILPSAVYNRGNLELDNSSYFVVVPGDLVSSPFRREDRVRPYRKLNTRARSIP